MEFPTKTDIRRLVDSEPGLCISISFPTTFGNDETIQNAVRLKNALTKAEEQLVDRGMRAPDARELLKTLQNVSINGDQLGRASGVAIYRSRREQHVFRLAAAPQERVIVGERFAVTPLVASTSEVGRFHILAISRNNVRLLDADATGFERGTVDELPANIESALNLQGADRGMQVHSGAPGNRKQAAVFHGQGGRAESRNDDLQAYFRMIDGAVTAYLMGTNGPVFLAGVAEEVAAFRALSQCSALAGDALNGNVDHLEDRQCFEQALPLAREYYRREERFASRQIRELNGTEKASGNIEVIIPAAHEGRVEALFVDPRETMIGHFDPETNRVVHSNVNERHDDLIELAVAETYRHDGQVYAVSEAEMPEPGAVAALFRY